MSLLGLSCPRKEHRPYPALLRQELAEEAESGLRLSSGMRTSAFPQCVEGGGRQVREAPVWGTDDEVRGEPPGLRHLQTLLLAKH